MLGWAGQALLRRECRLVYGRRFSSSGMIVPDELISHTHGSGAQGGQLAGLRLFPDAITIEEEQMLFHELDPLLSPKEYQFQHWDNVIRGYRETEITKFKFPKAIQNVFERLELSYMGPALGIERPQSLAHISASGLAAMGGTLPSVEGGDGEATHPFVNVVPVLPQVHVIDLHKDGEILGHVDSVKFTGSMVAGLSLLSPSIMRFEREDGSEEPVVDILLNPRSLYIMTDKARYDWVHAVLGGSTEFKGRTIERDRRISVMFRNFL